MAQHRAVGLGDRAPEPALPEDGDAVRIVGEVAVEVDHERRPAVDPERAGGHEGALEAVRAPLAQHLARGEQRLAAALVVGGNAVHEGLDLLRRVEAVERGELRLGEPEVGAAREAAVAQQGHGGRGSGGRPARRAGASRQAARPTICAVAISSSSSAIDALPDMA